MSPTPSPGKHLAIVGGGWAGLAAAVYAIEAGYQVTLFEAARTWGGRARKLSSKYVHGVSHGADLDNGQHILIGAYTASLNLMDRLGVDTHAVLQRVPLALRFADGAGLAIPAWAMRLLPPLNLLAAIGTAVQWNWRDKSTLIMASLRWRAQGFNCPADWSVERLCAPLTPRVMQELIEPLCVSALNTPTQRASARVFLQVLRDALFGPAHGPWRASDLLLPRVHLGALLPEPAVRWLRDKGADLRLGRRVSRLEQQGNTWRIDGEPFDQVILACPSWEASRLVRLNRGKHLTDGASVNEWLHRTETLEHEAIATVYARMPQAAPAWKQALPMLALRSGPKAPAQFVFDRARLGGQTGMLALVISASSNDKAEIQQQALTQLENQLNLSGLEPVITIVEKRATFACVPGLDRPGKVIAPGLWACGDYVDGPYPATLEGAVRSAQQVIQGMALAAT